MFDVIRANKKKKNWLPFGPGRPCGLDSGGSNNMFSLSGTGFPSKMTAGNVDGGQFLF